MNFKTDILKALGLVSIILYAANTHAQYDRWDDEDYTPIRHGLEFGLNMGVYNANDKSALFYNGDGWYDLGDNSATLYSIEERLDLGTTEATVQNIIGTESFEIPWDSYSYDMRYDPALMMGLKTVYFWNPESALVLNIDACNLKAYGPWTMHIAGLPGQGQGSDNIKMYGVFGEERRMITSMGLRTSAYILDDAAWIFELGGTMTGVQVIRNFINVENQTFDLITMFNGPGQFSNATSRLTSVGFGFYGTIGLEALFEEGGNLEANLRISRDKIHLGSKDALEVSYDNNLWNASLYVTWMIPPHVGDFVKAAF